MSEIDDKEDCCARMLVEGGTPHEREVTTMATRPPKALSWREIDELAAEFSADSHGRFTTEDRRVLQNLRTAAEACREAERSLEAAVVAAHENGMSWGLIGKQIGITRQGTRQRFMRLVAD